ncbi:MAG: ROK family protein [Rhodocyclaceae bacterium]|nr:ROK family protein [Rhodocyclaceae bacterium]
MEPLLGFVSYRRQCETHRGRETNDLASKIKDRVEKVLHARQIRGGFFIDKTGIEREDFERKIKKTIQACKGRIFLLILTPGALDTRKNKDEDWLATEVQLAIKSGLEIVAVMATKYRQDQDFSWPEQLPAEISMLQKRNVNLKFIGDLDESYLVDATQHIATEIIRALPSSRVAETLPKSMAGVKHVSARKKVQGARREPGFSSIGIDIGGPNIRACIVDHSPEGHSTVRANECCVDVSKPVSARSIVEQVKHLVSEIHSQELLDDTQLRGIGIAAAGQVDLRSGVLKFSPALGIRNLSLKNIFAATYPGLDVRVDNDVRCATRCELLLGAGRDFENFVCIFVGSGVGSGISIHRKILFGSNYCAGEIGHTKIASDGPICNCGQTGCLEAFVKAGAICERARAKAIEWKSRGIETQLSDNASESTLHSIAQALETGDQAAQELANEIGQKLGIGIATYLNILNPGAVVLGGGVMSGLFMHMSEGVTRGIRDSAISDVANTPIIHSQYSDDGAAIGAALLFHPEATWPC